MAMRVMAGFGKDDNYYLPRSRVVPSDELQNMIWPWLTDCSAWVAADGPDHPTAKHFLEFLAELRKIVLQDAAAMLVYLRRSEESCEDRRRANHGNRNEQLPAVRITKTIAG
jgi:Centromere DNA-binding protein complex CBF3 subunit, domain 2